MCGGVHAGAGRAGAGGRRTRRVGGGWEVRVARRPALPTLLLNLILQEQKPKEDKEKKEKKDKGERWLLVCVLAGGGLGAASDAPAPCAATLCCC